MIDLLMKIEEEEKDVSSICKKLTISRTTFYRWKTGVSFPNYENWKNILYHFPKFQGDVLALIKNKIVPYTKNQY